MLKNLKLPLIVIFVGGFISIGLFIPNCTAQAKSGGDNEQASISVNLTKVINSDLVPSLFGFNIEWLPFELGYFRNGQVRPEVIDWLLPFSGAVYRYPGGEKANWFIWDRAVGPIETRKRQITNDATRQVALFGIDEFLDFTKQVAGVPLLVTNLFGEPRTPWPEPTIVDLNRNWVNYTNIVRVGHPAVNREIDCNRSSRGVTWWELGNELDWKGHRWSAAEIIDRSRKVALSMRFVDPCIKFVMPTRTTGWLSEEKPGVTSSFNRQIQAGMGDITSNYSTHIYYEGRSIPSVLKYIEDLRRDLNATTTGARIFVTEHARWPSKNPFGAWQKNWPQTGDLRAAVATADFMIGLMPMKGVDMALWHQLGARGPWQLFYRSNNDDQLWPNAVYWGLRVLRAGYLDEVMHSTLVSKSDAWPGYSVRASFLRSKDAMKHSLLVINRSGEPVSLRLEVPQWKLLRKTARHLFITGDEFNVANTEVEKNRVVMQERNVSVTFDQRGRAEVVLPPYSVSSYLF